MADVTLYLQKRCNVFNICVTAWVPPESRAKIKGSCVVSLLWKVIPRNTGGGLERQSREGGKAQTKMFYWVDHQLVIEASFYWQFLKNHVKFSSELCILGIMEEGGHDFHSPLAQVLHVRECLPLVVYWEPEKYMTGEKVILVQLRLHALRLYLQRWFLQ